MHLRNTAQLAYGIVALGTYLIVLAATFRVRAKTSARFTPIFLTMGVMVRLYFLVSPRKSFITEHLHVLPLVAVAQAALGAGVRALLRLACYGRCGCVEVSPDFFIAFNVLL